jgi:SHS2 domain-containing protein
MYRWVEHTGELELEVEADSDERVFEEALAAFRELAGDPSGDPANETIELAGADRATLFADWLAELAFLAETRGFVPEELERLDLRDDGLSADVKGASGEPPHLVKAVTYHRLSFEPANGGRRARAVLDV